MKEPYICIVGVCAAGKSTLAKGLSALGLKAYSVPQEHSFVRRLWAKRHPDHNLLIVLDAEFQTTKRRRPTISYGPERLEDQRERLEIARNECDLYLPTDDLSIDEVRERALSFVETWKERA